MSEPEKSARLKQIEARRERLKQTMPQRPSGVRVLPRDDTIRKGIKHPSGAKFPASGSVEWPLDSFTRRRLADGTVKREQQADQQQSAQARKPRPEPAA